MKFFLQILKERNGLLYWFGWFNFFVSVILLLLMPFDNMEIVGVGRWVKPFKFYSTVWILAWTLGWLMHYLSNKRKVRSFTWFTILTLLFENGLILLQAIRKTGSHFNIGSYFNALVFEMMGITIGIFTITVLFILIAFFNQKKFEISSSYVWGIRLGLLIFLLSCFEGAYMAALLKHTVGGEDGSQGLPFLNWSKQYGDLRIVHFFGVHALQLLPFFGWFSEKKKGAIFIISLFYFMSLLIVFLITLSGKSLF